MCFVHILSRVHLVGTALCANEASVVIWEWTYRAGRNCPIENIIQDTSARAWSKKIFVERGLLKSCTVVPRSVALESIKWLLKQKRIPGNHHAQSSLRQTGLGWGDKRFHICQSQQRTLSTRLVPLPGAETEAPEDMQGISSNLLHNLWFLHTSS